MRYIVIFIITLACVACSSSTPEPFSMPTVPVNAEIAKQQDVPLYFESLGTVRSSERVEIRPQVSGMLEKIHFTEGKMVQKGELLFSINSQIYSIKLQEAEAQLAQTKASLDTARKKMERSKELSQKSLISQQEWEELQSEVTQKEAQLMADTAKVAAAKLDFEHCTICSPITGKIGKISIHPGNLIAESQAIPLVTISNVNDLVIDFTVTENEFRQLSSNQLLENKSIAICSFTDQCEVINAKLIFLDNTFDEETGLLHMQATFSNEKGQFLPGQHVKVRIPFQTIQGATIVSQKAVKINQTGPYVYRIKEDNSIEIVQVKLGDEIAGNVVILEGIKAGDKVVTEGHLRLSPQVKVEIKGLL